MRSIFFKTFLLFTNLSRRSPNVTLFSSDGIYMINEAIVIFGWLDVDSLDVEGDVTLAKFPLSLLCFFNLCKNYCKFDILATKKRNKSNKENKFDKHKIRLLAIEMNITKNFNDFNIKHWRRRNKVISRNNLLNL